MSDHVFTRLFLEHPRSLRPGLSVVVRQALRVGVALLGFQLTLTQVFSVGARGLGIAVIALFATFAFTRWLARALEVESGLADLIAAGTSTGLVQVRSPSS